MKKRIKSIIKKAEKEFNGKFGDGGPTYICEVCLEKHYDD